MTGSFGDNAVDIEYDAWEAAAESGDWRAAAEQARSQMASSEPVVVAVVDTGVDASVSGTVYRGALVMQVTGTDAEPGEKGEPFGSYWRYNADGTWDYLPIELPEGQSLMLSATASDGEHLYAFGGWGYFDEAPLPSLSIVQGTLDSIVKIDIDAGTGP